MTKITLTDLANLQNETTAVNAINANNAALKIASDNTLSRDGTQPNTMGATLDMNSHQILNLPAPGDPTSPVRLKDVTTGISTITAATGSSGHTVPFLDGNNTYSGTEIHTGAAQFNADVYFKSGRPWADVRAYGAKGDFVTDDTAAIQTAAAAIGALGGGILYVPPGVYVINGTINLHFNTTLAGASRTSSYLITKTDVTLVHSFGDGQNNIKDIAILGKGNTSFLDTGTFGATQNCVIWESSGGQMTNVTIQGGSIPLYINNSLDAVFTNVDVSMGYGGTNVQLAGNSQNWYIRCKWDQGGQTGIGVTTNMPFPNWAATTAYTTGQVVITNNYAIQCKVGGTSGGSAPTLKNYGVNITDGAVTWVLLVPSVYVGVIIADTSQENHFYTIDLSGPFTNSIVQNATGVFPNTFFTDSVISNQILLQNGGLFSLLNCEIGGPFIVNSTYTGKFIASNNWASNNGVNFAVSAGVSNFVIANNLMAGGSISVSAGGSDHYAIVNNVAVNAVTDLGTGIHKTVTGNVT